MYGTYYYKHPLSMKNTYQIHLVHSCPSSSHPHNTYGYSHPIQVSPNESTHLPCSNQLSPHRHGSPRGHLSERSPGTNLPSPDTSLQSNSSWDLTRVWVREVYHSAIWAHHWAYTVVGFAEDVVLPQSGSIQLWGLCSRTSNLTPVQIQRIRNWTNADDSKWSGFRTGSDRQTPTFINLSVQILESC